MIRTHIDAGAACTIACLPVPLADGRQFGVMETGADHRVLRFEEKPDDPAPMPESPDHCLASMGIYVFNTKFLFEQLCEDATRTESARDFGKDVIPGIIRDSKVLAFPFRDRNTGDGSYWRDVGTIDAYFEANMDLVAPSPQLNLYDTDWPVRSYMPPTPPPKFVFAQRETEQGRIGTALDSLVCPGCIVSGGQVERSVLSSNVRVNSWAHVHETIMFDGVEIGRHAEIRRAIIDKNVAIPPGAKIGFDAAEDRAKGILVTDSGISVIGKGARLQ